MKPKILLIGTGRWGVNHLRTWLTLGVELFVVDTQEEALQKCRKLGVPEDHLGKDYRVFLPRVDAVDVVTPAETHYSIGCEAIDLGKDLFIEKPLTLLVQESQDLIQRANEKKLILQVGHIFRYEPPSQAVKGMMDRGELGEVKWLRGNFSGFKRPRSDSGVTMADAIHFVDLFNYFLDRVPRQVHARLLDVLGRGMDDNAWLWLDYGDIFATIEAGYFSPFKKREVLVVGTLRSVVVDYTVQQDKMRVYSNRHEKVQGEWKALEGEVHTIEFDPEEPLLIELRAFLESIRTRNRPLADGQSGIESVKIVEALLRSAQTGSFVQIKD